MGKIKPFMKISSVRHDNRKKAFEVSTRDKQYWFPFAKLHLRPTRTDPIASVCVDDELGHEAFTYELESGQEGTVHIDQYPRLRSRPRRQEDAPHARTCRNRVKNRGSNSRTDPSPLSQAALRAISTVHGQWLLT
jgi:hypothetical protein